MRSGIVTLTTDFGSQGPYVAAMKGVILSLAPDVQLIDVSHDIAPQNVLEGAFVLLGVIDAFPPDTVHLAVIDPGVGTDRRLVALRAADQWFLGPDNGLLGAVQQIHQLQGIWEITNPALRRNIVSSTFHGRDILAPAAAHLVQARDPDLLGPRLESIIRLVNFEPRSDELGVTGEVIFRDTFGNLVTNVTADRLGGTPLSDWSVEVAGQRIQGLSRTYADRPSGSLIALVGSTGWVEIALVNGDAGRFLTAGPGTTVWFRNHTRA
jgi:S-adenosylmethionine hydrolase